MCRGDDGFGRRLGEERACNAVDDGVQRATKAAGHDGEATSLGLEGDDAEVFNLREDKQAGAAVEVAELFIGNAAHDRDAVIARGFAPEAGQLRTAAGDDETNAGLPRSGDGEVGALVGLKGADKEPEVFTLDCGIGREEGGTDGGVENR